MAGKPDWGVISLDEANAFGSLDRAATARAAHQVIPEYDAFVQRLLEADEENVFVDEDGVVHMIQARKGVPQGMPLSPYLFPLAFRGPLRELKRRVDTLEGGGLVVAYQDDIYVLTRPGHFATVMGWAEELLAGIGLQLNATKTYYWVPPTQPSDAAVEAKGAKRDYDIKVLKQSLPTRLTGLQQLSLIHI